MLPTGTAASQMFGLTRKKKIIYLKIEYLAVAKKQRKKISSTNFANIGGWSPRIVWNVSFDALQRWHVGLSKLSFGIRGDFWNTFFRKKVW